jgi:hypothetical protein
VVTVAVLVAVGAGLALAWHFAGVFLRDAVFAPLARELAAIGRGISRLPGIVVWLVAVTVACLVALRALLRDTVILRRRRPRRAPQTERTELQRIARSLARRRSRNADRHLANEFVRMSAMLVAQERAIPVDAAARAIRLGSVPLPRSIEAVIRAPGGESRRGSRVETERRYEEAIATLERSVEGGIFPCN